MYHDSSGIGTLEPTLPLILPASATPPLTFLFIMRFSVYIAILTYTYFIIGINIKLRILNIEEYTATGWP